MAFYGRGPNKIKDPYTLPDMYNEYIAGVEKGSVYDVSYDIYKTVYSMYIKELMRLVLDDGVRVKFPSRLGTFQVVKKKMFFTGQQKSNKGIDWANTIKEGKIVRHINDHTDGFKFLFNWGRVSNARLDNIYKYRLKPTRTLKRTLAKKLKEEGMDYFEAFRYGL